MSNTLNYTVYQKGETKTESFRLFFEEDGYDISPIHDIPLWKDESEGIARMVVEIPRGRQEKMEMSTDEDMNPIKQDIKKGKLRRVFYPYPFNYGALSQTWEDPDFVNPLTKAKGDGDPIDACDISSIECQVGDVIDVKILGVWGMIDDGETDWKVLCINAKDPIADELTSLRKVEKYFPGVIGYTFYFLQNYKVPSGSEPNVFAFKGKLRDAKFAHEIVNETHEQWQEAFITKNEKLTTKSKVDSEGILSFLNNLFK
jgi:inorganic pyrophosphatase